MLDNKAQTQKGMIHGFHKFWKLNIFLSLFFKISGVNANTAIHPSVIDYWDVDSSKINLFCSWKAIFVAGAQSRSQSYFMQNVPI